MLFNKRAQIYIFIIAGILVADFVLFGYMPLRNRLKSLEKTRSEQSRVIADASACAEQLPKLKEQLVCLRSVVENYEFKVPLESDLGGFLKHIAGLMTQYNLVEQVVEPGQEIDSKNLRCIPVTMRCTGTLPDIFEFYAQLQTLDRLVRIEQIRLTNDSSYSGQVSMETRAIIFYRQDKGKTTPRV